MIGSKRDNSIYHEQ